jgi:hypothetical protein
VPEQIIRPQATWAMLSVGNDKGWRDFAPRLVKVRLGPRSVGFTLSSIERLIQELATAPPATSKQMEAKAVLRLRRHRAAGRKIITTENAVT